MKKKFRKLKYNVILLLTMAEGKKTALKYAFRKWKFAKFYGCSLIVGKEI